MKVICSGDWHIRATPTKFRKPNYYELMFGKLNWILDFATKNNTFVVIQPGDFFDSPDVPNHVMVDTIKAIGDIDVCTVYGQHDCAYRNHNNTALSVLIEDGTVDLLSNTPIEYGEKKQVDIYGASWDAKIPEVKDKNNFNILVLHKMIVKDESLFPDQKNFSAAAAFSKENKDYDLIVSGDNHHSFSYVPKNKSYPSIINCGSLMRMTTAQYEHKPCIWVVDTETGELEQHFIPIKPIIEVFKEEAEEIKERDAKTEAFIEMLSSSKADTQLSFEDNLKTLLSEQKLSENIEKLANEFVAEYYKGEKG